MKTRSKFKRTDFKEKDASQMLVAKDVIEELPSLIDQLTNERGTENILEVIINSSNKSKSSSNSEIIIQKLRKEVNVCFTFIMIYYNHKCTKF